MSNIAKKPIKIEDGVNVNIHDGKVEVVGSKGTLEERIPSGIAVTVEDGFVKVKKINDTVELEKFAGLASSLITNMIKGVTSGFQKQLELTGVGYRARVDGTDLILNVGFAVPVKVAPRTGVTITVAENIITVAGINKQFVGDTASDIRRVRPPDPYKGKGIKYAGERLRRKVGKAAKAVGTK